MALPTVVAVGTVANGIGDITPALPSGWAQNDIFLAFLECREVEAIVVPSGWAHVTGSPVPRVSSDSELTVVWKRAGSSESAPTFTDAGNHQIGRIIAVRGCPTSGNPWDVIATDTAATSTAVSIPGATTTVADCLVVAAVSTGADLASTTEVSGWTNASLANLTERIDDWTLDGNGGGIGVATGEKAAAGAYSATTATLVTTFAQSRLSIALKPAGGATTHTAAASVSGAGTVAGTATRKAIAAGAVSGTGTVASSAVRKAVAQAAIQGTGGVNATGGVTRYGAAVLSGTGSVAATGTRTAVVVASLAGQGLIAADATRTTLVAVGVAGIGTISATGRIGLPDLWPPDDGEAWNQDTDDLWQTTSEESWAGV